MDENEIRQGPAGGPPPQPQPQQQPYPHPAQQPPPAAAGHPLFQPVPPAPPKKKGNRIGVVVAATALAAALVGGVSGAAIVGLSDSGGSSSNTSALGSANGQQVSNSGSDVSGIAAKVLPSVVQVNARTGEGEAIGSGVITTADGRILTNAHVVAGAVGDVTVTLSDGKKYQAEVLGADSKADIAVLQARGASGLTPAALGDSGAVKVGEEVVAIGSPAGLQNTVTSGIVSATGRKLSDIGRQQESPMGRITNDKSQAPSYTAIQTDAAINQGNSGGPLVNAAGQVIGINTLIYSPSGGSIGLGFAIPINDAKTIMDKIAGS
ncbi:S1C family serine protease [Amycolatopsis anabasis]|uniref:S1C family serine protease n=1 Tax=Amycolatopsis anabasis TaxID=1840409 RepID=UPI00131BADD1|nr:trypsin-like peptidase domain-containing protein [Amycolatopsis anabasis]